jgi:hypothetical protein
MVAGIAFNRERSSGIEVNEFARECIFGGDDSFADPYLCRETLSFLVTNLSDPLSIMDKQTKEQVVLGGWGKKKLGLRVISNSMC